MSTSYEIRTRHGVTLARIEPALLSMSILIDALREYLEDPSITFEILED
jgi:hypothetical protein